MERARFYLVDFYGDLQRTQGVRGVRGVSVRMKRTASPVVPAKAGTSSHSFLQRADAIVSLRIAAVAGGSPAATYFSCFAKKSKQKKATPGSSPFGFPALLGDSHGDPGRFITTVAPDLVRGPI